MISLILLLPLLASATPSFHRVFVGELYEEKIDEWTTVTGELDGQALPPWITVVDGMIKAIPTENDLGQTFIKLDHPDRRTRLIEFKVEDEKENPCGQLETMWIEAIYGWHPNITNKLKAVQELGVNNTFAYLRIYDSEYGRRLRKVEVTTGEKEIGKFFVAFMASCNDFDLATDVLDDFIDEQEDSDYDFITITRGYVVDIPREKTTTRVYSGKQLAGIHTTTELIRTTRRLHDSKPVRINSLPVFRCTRGHLCELEVPEWTFEDAEDGNAHSLRLSIVPLDGAEEWMELENRNTTMAGVPLTSGEYSYRLEARDRSQQMASAPFSVIVQPAPKPNHLIAFDLDAPSPSAIEKNPIVLAEFMRTLGRSLHADPRTFAIDEVSVNGNKTVITWSNVTITNKFCDKEAIGTMAAKMIIKKKARTKTEFVKTMSHRFYVRKASTIYQGTCGEVLPDHLTTVAPTISSALDSQLPWWTYVVILIGVLFLVAALYICCAFLLYKKNKKNKKSTTDFVGKNQPVVFPDEVQENDETTAGTPMLAREERPPLKVSQHENPLYKPPPPISNSSPRVMPVGSAANQKLPPPYIPP